MHNWTSGNLPDRVSCVNYVTIAMWAQESIYFTAVICPGQPILKYALLGLDTILGKGVASAGLIPLLQFCCFPAFNPTDAQNNTERPRTVPVSGVCFAALQIMNSIRFARNDHELNRIDFRLTSSTGRETGSQGCGPTAHQPVEQAKSPV